MSHEEPALARPNYSDLVAAYAARLHATAAGRHHVVCPLGAWLLLALAAPLATDADREELERVLGCGAADARRAADRLLALGHPALALAFAAWHQGDIGAELDGWCRALPSCADAGPAPTQGRADEWVREVTKGQVGALPLGNRDDLRLMLTSTVATESSWHRAFELVPATELGGAWASRVRRVLRRRVPDVEHVAARTAAAGIVGVSHERSIQNLDVVSVIAAPEVPPARVLAAAYEVAAKIAELPSTAVIVRPFELPRAGHAWVVRERVLEDAHGPARVAHAEVTIPAWSATTELADLVGSPGTGFATVARAILGHLPPDPRGDRVGATQSASAHFDTNGFSAAAATILRFEGLAMHPARRIRERTIEVRFDRPFAVVAVTHVNEYSRPESLLRRGLPAFGAWVSEPTEPSEPTERERHPR